MTPAVQGVPLYAVVAGETVSLREGVYAEVEGCDVPPMKPIGAAIGV